MISSGERAVQVMRSDAAKAQDGGSGLPDLSSEDATGALSGQTGATIEVDLSHHMGPPSFATFDFPILGFDIALADADGELRRVVEVRRHPNHIADFGDQPGLLAHLAPRRGQTALAPA